MLYLASNEFHPARLRHAHVRSPLILSQLMPDKSFVITIVTRAIFAKLHLIIHVTSCLHCGDLLAALEINGS
jgi:hypothetical protein